MNDKLKEEIRKTTGNPVKRGVILYPTIRSGDRRYDRRKLSNGFMTSKTGPTQIDACIVGRCWENSFLCRRPGYSPRFVSKWPTNRQLIIYPGAKRLAPNLIAEDGTIGIRITREEFTRSLIFRYNKPIVSTSANISGEPSPHFFGEISEEIKNAVDYIEEYGRNDHNPAAPSSIIKLGMGRGDSNYPEIIFSS